MQQNRTEALQCDRQPMKKEQIVIWHTYPKPRALQATFAEVFVKE